ncbi:MAG: HNH endonuclease [Ruminiclostridium sp.]|nr:HNH endonuclease [Ruminiclostridium sp.]
MEFELNEYHRNVSDKDLLDDIVRVAKELGKDTLTIDEYTNNRGKYHCSTITKRFGGWLKALQLCGLSPNERQINSSLGTYTQSYITDDELIEDLKKVSSKLNKQTLSGGEYDKNGKYSSATYYKRFKSWNNALKQAGLVPFDHPLGGNYKISEYQCVEEIERVWIELGRQPTTTDIKNGASKYSLHVFERRFGSWRKALEFFVAYINGEQDVEKPIEEELPQPVEYKPVISVNDKPKHSTHRDINLRLRFNVMKRDNFKCCICGRSPATTPGLELHIDHIKPWSKGGETVIDNLQTLCSDCNLGKSNLC